MLKRIIKIILLIIWMGVIFSFSSDTGDLSTKKSDGFVIRTIEVFIGRDLNNQEKEKWTTYLEMPIRKLAHFTEYFILGILICMNIISLFKTIRIGAIVSLFGGFIYACSDEIHQLFVSGRSGQISDALLDTIGVGVGVLIFISIIRKCSRNEQKERIG